METNERGPAPEERHPISKLDAAPPELESFLAYFYKHSAPPEPAN